MFGQQQLRCCCLKGSRFDCLCGPAETVTPRPAPLNWRRERVLAYAARLQAAAAASKQQPPENMLTCLAELFLQVGWGHCGSDILILS